MRGTWEVGVIGAAAWACTGGAPAEASSTGTRERGARPSAEPVDAPLMRRARYFFFGVQTLGTHSDLSLALLRQ